MVISSFRFKALSCCLMMLNACIINAQNSYFQQEVNFRINVTLDDSRNLLLASEEIEYINNSPDTLGFIYFHLWPNAYSSNSTDLAKQLFSLGGRQKLFNDPRKQGWIDSIDFMVGNMRAEWENLQGQPDICIVKLPATIHPGDTIYISTPFRVKVPQGNISRMEFNDGVYQISQWYPKPAVYDRNGWHPMPYLDQGEYYSEFGSFDVTINIPEDYVAGATGDLQTESEIKWLETEAARWRAPRLEQEVSASLKTLHFKGKDIHDFAWVASKRFRVISGKITLPRSGREVTTWVMYTAGQALVWENAPEYVNRALLRFSEWIGDYPYNTFTAAATALAAGSGMEYPGLAIIGNADDTYSLDEVIAHEACHSWFYSSLGSDERRFPFMDEGITTFYEERYMNMYHPGKKMWELYFRNPKMARFMKIDRLPAGRISEIQWLINARNNLEQPLDLAAPEYTERNYGDLVYFKAAQGFSYLRSFLDDSLFDNIMKDYYSTWKSRHPSPVDLRRVFAKHAVQDLSWFFDDFLGTTRRYDYKIARLENDRILVRNKGELNSPLAISGFMNDSLVFSRWHEGFSGKKWITLDTGSFDEIRLNAFHIVPEINYTNNNIRGKGIFRKSDPMSPQLLVSVEDPERRTLMLVPLVNWNRADGFMAGLGFNNGFMIPKKAEYLLMPFYSFPNRDISGKGRVAFNFTPYNSPVRKLTLSVEGARFGATAYNHYYKVSPGLDIWFRNRDMVSAAGQRVFSRFVYATDIKDLNFESGAGSVKFWQLGYSYFRSGLVNPFDLTAMYESGNSFGKLTLEMNYRLSYNGRNKGLDIRLFTGTMTRTDPIREFYSFAPSGRSGGELYLFEGDFPDRFAVYPSDFWSRQMIITEGAIISPVNDSAGYSRSLFSLSLESHLPGFAGNLPVKPFAGFVYTPGPGRPYFIEAGIKAGIWNFLEFNIPLLVSDNIRSNRNSVKDRIRFTLNLESILRLRM